MICAHCMLEARLEVAIKSPESSMLTLDDFDIEKGNVFPKRRTLYSEGYMTFPALLLKKGTKKGDYFKTAMVSTHPFSIKRIIVSLSDDKASSSIAIKNITIQGQDGTHQSIFVEELSPPIPAGMFSPVAIDPGIMYPTVPEGRLVVVYYTLLKRISREVRVQTLMVEMKRTP